MVDITDIKRLAKEIEIKYDLNYYEILQRYMFERVLERIEKLWNIYSNKYKYAKGIDINEILNLLKDIIKKLDLEVVAV